MDLKQIDEEARQAAIKEIKNMFQRPGQLEKVDQYRHRVYRKKVSIEAMLKTCMQNQTDDVKVGVKKLVSALEDIGEIDGQMKGAISQLTDVPAIYDALEAVRDENAKHSQYMTAMENLKHIFTVQSSVAKTMQWIEEDKLLHAHQCLSDLENSRDDLLFELHKLPKQNAHDKITLKRYFEKVETVSATLEKKIRLILQRTLNTVRKEPTVIVTALRIIEREEKADAFALQQQKQTGFIPPGRPKEWRKKALQVLNEAVVQRIEGSKLEERSDNKLWLVRDLELTRQFILEDLRVVKSLCVPCFPPHYNILKEYVSMYHNALSKYLEELIQMGLEGNEFVTILSWIMNTYPGRELMQHPDLLIELSDVGPLVSNEVLKEMESAYLKTMERNYQDWMTKTLETEKADWINGVPADSADQYYHTSAPVIIFQMIDQNLQVTNTIHSDLTFNALILSIQQVIKYGHNYRGAIIEYKERHFRDRSQAPFFTQHIITIVNNCAQMKELAQQMKQLYWPKSKTMHYEEFERLLNTYQALRDEAGLFLLEEAFLDLEIHFNELFTLKWVGTTVSVDTICVTLEDYFQDYNHLRSVNFEYVINEAQRLVAKRYIKAMLSKRLSKPRQECEIMAKKVIKEAKQIKMFFEKVAPNVAKNDSPIDVISNLANLLTCDAEMLILDLHTLLSSYPSLTEDHVVRLFYMRNDFKASEVKEKVHDAIVSKKVTVSHDKQDSIFKEIVFSDKLW
ncbi:exocyst complex component 3 [Aedes albopictus]|uniref:Exocyst complex component 3 n=1 Tax=Aedes albopictus TaxID=7160 RepID=A0ABM1XYA0_AEDAL|nr:exocyst complex component 3-like [Aedes albopictus]XP_019547157.2 exocyst complex component 3-like [Aedes albopictus]